MKKNLLFLVLCLSFAWANAQTTILSEDFEGGKLPKGWKVVSVAKDSGWIVGKAAVVGSAGLTFTGNTTNLIATNEDKCNCDKNEDLLILPKMNLKGKKAVFASFNIYFGGRTDTGIKENAYIQASTDAGKTWKVVSEITPTINDAKTALIWQTQSFSLKNYLQDTAVWVAVKFTDNKGYLYGMGIDDVKVFEPITLDAGLKLAASKKFAIKTTPVQVKGKLTNYGASTITDVEMTYKVAGKTETQKITGLNIAPLASIDITHPTPYNYTATGQHTFDVSIDKVNGSVDGDSKNNSGSFSTVVITKNVQRNVVFEEGTGTWCGWCPRGAVFMDSMAKEFPKTFIGVAVHNGSTDPMKVVEYDAGLTKTPGFTGFPGVVIDRSKVIDPSEMFSSYDDARAELNPFTLTQKMTYDTLTRKMTVIMKTSAAMTTTGDYRFNVVLTEDGVKGTTATYNQTNYYANNAAGEMGGYENLPNPVPAKIMVYNHVGRAILGTYAGKAGSIPASIKEGDEYTTTFTYTVPATMKPKNMHVVGMVLDAETGAILTGITEPLIGKSNVGTNEIFENNNIAVYPNPMSNEATIEVNSTESVEVSVFVANTLGQQVASRNYGKMAGTNKLPFVAANLPNGIYTIHVKMGDKLATKKITIQR
jgi:thiol-disulfide isomerase/thioredoxin